MERGCFSRERVCGFNYSLLLCLMAIAMSTSNFFMNLIWVLLLVNWIFEGQWQEKWLRLKQNYLVQAVSVLLLLHVVGLLWSDNLAYGLSDIRQKLPLLAVPLVIGSSRQLNEFRWVHLQSIFVGAVAIVAIICTIRYCTIPDLDYRELNPWISHIRYSLMVVLAIVLLVANIRKNKIFAERLVDGAGATRKLFGREPCDEFKRQKTVLNIARLYTPLTVLLIVFLCGFLMLQQSYTGIVALVAIGAVVALCSRNKKVILFTAALLIAAAAVSSYYVADYYHLRSLSAQPLKCQTVNGNPYIHANDGLIECGGYTNNYICEEEIEREWPKHSRIGLDEMTVVGYPLRGALIRYLTCMDLPKDSLGICQLSPRDIAAIEQGIGNPSYLRQGSPKKFFDQLLYEIENGRHNGSIRDFTMLERLELWSNGWQCIRQHPWFGVGTGDVVDVAHQQLKLNDSPIADTAKHIHNQYLTLLLTFGIVGFAIIAFFFVRILVHGPRLRLTNVAFVTLVLVSFVNEDTLETLAGVMLVIFWGALLNGKKNNVSISHTK